MEKNSLPINMVALLVRSKCPRMPRLHDRYDAQRICLGQRKCEELAKLRLFMVGRGAIGCEMLKNYALLGICQKDRRCFESSFAVKPDLFNKFWKQNGQVTEVIQRILTDESVSKPMDNTTGSGDDLLDASNRLQGSLNEDKVTHVLSPMNPVDFEKDDDTNGHIDFISTAAVTVELIKLLDKLPLEVYKNAFLNLALPVIVLSEPGQVEKTVIKMVKLLKPSSGQLYMDLIINLEGNEDDDRPFGITSGFNDS
uniref:Ubiquitin-activating enzyme SCCH domain-containing protein n=1 Tax=Magallana gigas TaxID=29159 RepID=A0A8W8HLJ0_MAGGI